jgi:hypothetical protein
MEPDTEIETVAPLHCYGVKDALLADDKSSVLVELILENGQIFPLELDEEGIDLMSRIVLSSAKAMGTQQEDRLPLRETVPSASVLIDADEVLVRANADGPVMVLRVGSIDITVKLPNQVLANAMAVAVSSGGNA